LVFGKLKRKEEDFSRKRERENPKEEYNEIFK
jgi:hypothetical protein